jgi:hypothetical protein
METLATKTRSPSALVGMQAGKAVLWIMKPEVSDAWRVVPWNHERKQLEEAAKKNGQKLSEWMRRILLQNATA